VKTRLRGTKKGRFLGVTRGGRPHGAPAGPERATFPQRRPGPAEGDKPLDFLPPTREAKTKRDKKPQRAAGRPTGRAQNKRRDRKKGREKKTFCPPPRPPLSLRCGETGRFQSGGKNSSPPPQKKPMERCKAARGGSGAME